MLWINSNLPTGNSRSIHNTGLLLLLLCPFSGCQTSEYLISSTDVQHGGASGAHGGRPSFRSTPTTYREEIGTTALLLCKVNNLGDSVIVWKQPDRIISAGMGMIRKDNRMSLIGHATGINLEIRHLKGEDAGSYICEVENSGEPVLQTNQLQVLVPPQISTSHSGKNLTVRKGSSLTLSCNASGFPLPKISWQRQHQMLPSGEKVLRSNSIKFHKVERSDAGVYICTADNGVGAPVSADVDLNIIYSPEVEIDKSWVHGGVGYEAVISCLVYGNPKPEVRWYLETMLLDRNEFRIMEKFGQRNRLVMTSLKEKDFGNYTCLAENDLGKASGTIELSGKPNEPMVISNAQGMYSDEYNITWTVESYSAITKFRLIYRKFISESDPYSDARSRWINYILDMERDSAYQLNHSFWHEKSYQFFALEPNTRYEVMVQAENVHGWGKYSELFIFSTRAPADVPVELPVESLAGSGVTSQTITLVGGGGAATNLGVSAILLLTQILLLLS